MELSSTRKITRKRSVVVEDEDVMARRRRSPHFPSSDFAEIADKTSALEEKCRGVFLENESLRLKASQLDNENLRLKNQIKDLEVMVQKEKEACDQAAQLRQKWEKGIRSLQQSNMDLTQKLKDAEAELQEKNDKIRQAQEQLECLQKMRQGVQSMLDISYQDFKEKEAVAWFTELDSPLPKVNLKFLTEYMSEFASFWEELGVSLGVDNAVREEQTQSISARQKCLHILQRWITLREASYIALLEALDKLNQRPLAKKIEMKILNGAENVKDM